MSLATFFAALFSTLLVTNCTGVIPTVGVQEDVQYCDTSDPLPLAFTKLDNAMALEGVLVHGRNPQAGTLQATAYHGKVTVYALIEPSHGQTRVRVLSRTEPGTFSHGKLDLSGRILARYAQEPAS